MSSLPIDPMGLFDMLSGRADAPQFYPDVSSLPDVQGQYFPGDIPGASQIMGSGYNKARGPREMKAGGPLSAIPDANNAGDYWQAIRVFEDDSTEYMLEDDPNLPAMRPTVGANYQFDSSYGGREVDPQAGPFSFPSPLRSPAGAPGEPAEISYSPTSTTNPARPRTVAAGYNGGRRVLTVVFRDGTYYNYYGVSALEWSNFVRSRSKGEYIKNYLDGRGRGVADATLLPDTAREALYRTARTGQVLREGVTGKQKLKYTRNLTRTHGSGNIGGTARARAKKLRGES